MRYGVIIIDGAAGWALDEREGKTCLEIAHTPNLDAMTREGILGIARTVPEGMEPSSACACMSVLGYDPALYYKGRSAIEAVSMGVPVGGNDVVFRCNLIAVRSGSMWSYSSGYIGSEEAAMLIEALNNELGNEKVRFFPGTSYRHICRLTGSEDTLKSVCTPPHDIPDLPIAEYLPRGEGSELLNELMARSRAVLEQHPVNRERESRGDIPSNMIWLFWGSGKIPALPDFNEAYGLRSALTSGVDLLRGLGKMMNMQLLDIPGVTDGLDNDNSAQAEGALQALEMCNLVVVHIEAPDEAGHDGSIDNKVEAIERIDSEVIGRFRDWHPGDLRMLIMPDHPTPVQIRTHTSEPVPFILWGPGFKASGSAAFTEMEATKTGVHIEEGYTLMGRLVSGKNT
jgi:2,3-bisphosphoglycerate-independent phosphoglycerate mutase